VRFPGAFIGLLALAESASAGHLLDYIREYDLNGYAIGVAASTD